ncbi:serine protease snake-like [Contarinia nasturtii]|uniref:serine protease snake-like n=1 Tax=Contarinia nasturtii TaxID=265458 RepID=UPI0012D4AABC|nr:serine protease snake-like [Contarinia nasturtii]
MVAILKTILPIVNIQFLVSVGLAETIGALARTKCEQYMENAFKISSMTSLKYGVAKCDPLMIPLIVGGTRVDRTEFPHMAAIGFGHSSGLVYLCGGTLISEHFVMTAAHCEKDRNRGPARVVRLGSIDLTTNDDHTHIIPIDKIYSHPDYKTSSKYNDIALIRLARSIYFNEFIRPACINVNNNVEWTTAIATGFGLTSNDHSIGSSHLLKVQLKKFTLNICQRAYKADRFMKRSVIESQLCAGDLTGSKDTCQGDSGGPLQIVIAKPHCVYSVIGITSFGKSCGFQNTPAIYTNVAHYTSWIEQMVWQNISNTISTSN